MLIFTAGVLLYSVCMMRSTIKKSTYAFPNEKLMIVHVVNFFTWSILVITNVSLLTNGRRFEKDYEAFVKKGEATDRALKYIRVIYWDSIIASIQSLFTLYVNSFLMMLILVSTAEKEKMIKDVVLGR